MLRIGGVCLAREDGELRVQQDLKVNCEEYVCCVRMGNSNDPPCIIEHIKISLKLKLRLKKTMIECALLFFIEFFAGVLKLSANVVSFVGF